MITVFNAHISQEFWRTVYPHNRAPQQPVHLDPREQWACNERDVWKDIPAWIDAGFLQRCPSGKLGVLVRDQASRRVANSHVTQVWSGPIPEGSFFDSGNGKFVCSPCFVFLQMASKLDLASLIAYGDELCGLYAFNPCAERGIEQRAMPLVKTEQLAQFIATARGCYGRKRAAQAVRYLVDRSASPMETTDEMMLCLPYKLGGYCIAPPTMNHEVILDARSRRIAKKSRLYIDLCWEDAKMAIEHQGQRDHTDSKAFSADRARINALCMMGYDAIELTSGQVADLFSFEEIARRVAKSLNYTIDKTKLGATPARLALRHALFNWNDRYGRLETA